MCSFSIAYIYECVYVCMHRIDLLVWITLRRLILGEDWFFLSQQSLLPTVLPLEGEPCQIFPVDIGISTGVVLFQTLHLIFLLPLLLFFIVDLYKSDY